MKKVAITIAILLGALMFGLCAYEVADVAQMDTAGKGAGQSVGEAARKVAPVGSGTPNAGVRPPSTKSKPKKKKTNTPEAEYYSNCAQMRRDFPNGVSSSHASYRRALDRDRDGRACERN